MTIRHGYLYDFKRACHVEGRIKISFLSNSQVIFQDEKKKKKKEAGSGQLETDSRKAPVGIQRGHLEFFRPQVHEHEVCRVTDRQAQSCGKSLYLQPCWTKPGRAQHLKT